MLTKNGKFLLGLTTSSSRQFKKTDGQEISLSLSAKSSGAIWLGSGTTPPSVDDYTIENRLTGLTAIGTTVSNADSYERNYIAIITETFTNSTSEDITVKELGWVANTNNASAETLGTLIVREVIDPVVIPAGESKTFTIRIG